jgi:NADPH-dependent 7-cyano-7-deazaguanine reductase QueF
VSGPVAVPAVAGVRVSAAGWVRHLCPHVDEADFGSSAIAWTTKDATIELHSLAAYLGTYADQKISHEDLVAAITADLDALPGITDVTVTAQFHTAGFVVEVSSAVPGDALVPAGT